MAKIVIDIDDNLYTRLFDNGVDNYDDAVDMAKAIRKGTPLPKGHGDLIDRKVLLNNGYQMEPIEMWYGIKYAPTIIEADKEVDND